jgi:uncharacterized protein YwqG
MRVAENLFDYGPLGIVAVSTCDSSYGAVPVHPYGHAFLWRDEVHYDLVEHCTRPITLDAQRAAYAESRSRIAHAVAEVHQQLDWCESHASESFREMPTHAVQLGSGLLLVSFVGMFEPWAWRLIDVAQQRTMWEIDGGTVRTMVGLPRVPSLLGSSLGTCQFPISSGLDFVEIRCDLKAGLFMVDVDGMHVAEWSLDKRKGGDRFGMREGMLTQEKRSEASFALVDPRTGTVLRSFTAPNRSKIWPKPTTSLGSDRVAVAHADGTVDIIDNYGAQHFAIRPLPRQDRSNRTRARMARDGNWLGIDGCTGYAVVDLENKLVAEIPIAPPNVTDAINQVRYDRCVIPASIGVIFSHDNDQTLVPYPTMSWRPVVQPAHGKRTRSKRAPLPQIKTWRRPALALKRSRTGKSWLYGSPDIADVDVPRHQGNPMAMLARIDLSEASAAHPDLATPATGVLLFFTAVDAEGLPLLDESFNPVATAVLWQHHATRSRRTKSIEIAPKQGIEFARHDADLPTIGAAIVRAANLDDDRLETYRAWLQNQGWAEQPGGHRLGGYPTMLQNNDLGEQAARIADPTFDASSTADALAAAARWRLLLQLDSDNVCMWGSDSGVLYYLIHDDDLAQADFSRVVAICEGC